MDRLPTNKESISTTHKILIEFIEIVRNGAITVGDTPITNMYRQCCMEQAYWMLCRDIAPELIVRGMLEENEQVLNLLDRGALYQQGLIRPDLQYRKWVTAERKRVEEARHRDDDTDTA